MKEIKKIVCENLINLRKSNNMTQTDLAKKINYSDKAISRWENGEVAPDYEILQSICDVYNVPIGYLFESHDIAKEKKTQYGNKIAVVSLCICIVWTVITCTYTFMNTILGINFWQIFIWGVPLTCFVVQYCNKKYFKNRIVYLVFQSIIVWSLLCGLYLQTIAYNFWAVFFIGIPAQLTVIVSSYIKKDRNKF